MLEILHVTSLQEWKLIFSKPSKTWNRKEITAIKTAEMRKQNLQQEEIQVQEAERQEQIELQTEQDARAFKILCQYPVEKTDQEILQPILEELRANCSVEALRTHQAELLDMFLCSPHHVSCAELYPNFGKSMLLGILATYLRKVHPDAKILVLEPNKCLAHNHKKLYC